jgi:hypothetical protein
MNLAELKDFVDRSIESAIEHGDKPEEIEVSIQIDTYGKSDVVCSSNVEAHYDNDACTSGFVLVGSIGYEA